MAQVAGTTDTFDLIGLAEDVEDIIYNISPTDTPAFTMAKRIKATAVNHQWQTDALAAAAATAGSTTILLDVRAIGTTNGGFTQKSPTFRWPVDLCTACLTVPTCTQEEADASCLPGQDIWDYCETVVEPTP